MPFGLLYEMLYDLCKEKLDVAILICDHAEDEFRRKFKNLTGPLLPNYFACVGTCLRTSRSVSAERENIIFTPYERLADWCPIFPANIIENDDISAQLYQKIQNEYGINVNFIFRVPTTLKKYEFGKYRVIDKQPRKHNWNVETILLSRNYELSTYVESIVHVIIKNRQKICSRLE